MITTDFPTLQDFHIDGIKHITPTEALAAVSNNEATLLDVREENECVLERIQNDQVQYLPMSEITERVNEIVADKPIIVVCAGGVRSAKVAKFLMANGINNCASLEGGMHLWRALGLPTDTLL